MNDKTVQVQIKSIYGNEMIYPVCEAAKVFASMVGQKTLTRRDIDHIKKLGYTVDVVQAQPNTL